MVDAGIKIPPTKVGKDTKFQECCARSNKQDSSHQGVVNRRLSKPGKDDTCPVLCVLVAAVFLAVSAVPLQGAAQDKPIALKVANWVPVGSKQSLLLESWGKDLEKRTNGGVKVNYYPAGILVPAIQAYQDTVLGVSDVSQHALGYTIDRFPLTAVLDLPLGYPNNTVPSRLANAFYARFKPKEFDEVKILWFHAQAPGIVHTATKPVNKLEDLAGLRMRTYGSNTKLMSLLGGTPVVMPIGEVFNALSKGQVDGLLGSFAAAEEFRFGEILQYHTENYATSYSAVFVVAMNKKRWNSLPADIRKIIDAMSSEYIEKYAAMWDDTEKSGKAIALKKGDKMIGLSFLEHARWVEKARPIFSDYLDRMRRMGLPGDEALKFAQDYLEPYRKKGFEGYMNP